MASEDTNASSGRRLVQPDGFVLGARRNSFAVGRVGTGVDLAKMAYERPDSFARASVTDYHDLKETKYNVTTIR